MEGQNSAFPVPTTCYKIKSQGNSWLGFDDSKNVKFQKEQERSCHVILVPYVNGRYMLQLYLARTSKLEDLETSCVKECHPIDRSHEGGQCCADSVNGDTWFFCKRGKVMSISHYVQEWHDDFLFFLEFDQHGCISFSSGISKRYWTLGSSGQLLVGGQKICRKETFQLIEYGLQMDKQNSIWFSMAPVRVHMKSHTGHYLCCASTIISAAAEVPCCCEEFLLDMNFPPLPPHCESWYLDMKCTGEAKQGFRANQSSICRVRTANGKLNWSAGADGKLITVPVDEAQGHEHFVIELLPKTRHPVVRLSHHYSQNNADCSCYVSVEPSSKVVCKKLKKKGKWEEFSLELVSGSRVLIQSVHGYFVGSGEASCTGIVPSFPRHTNGMGEWKWKCSSIPTSFVDSSPGAWRLRAHGDSSYTLVAAISSRDRGDTHLCVDNKGKLMQSNEPAVYFPSVSSLFEIKPVTRSGISAFDDIALDSSERATIVGFSIKTIRKINGKQRYLSAEPNGTLRANCVRVSRWETFRFLDVDATASAVLPNDFLCVPAAVNKSPVTSVSNVGLTQGLGNALSFLDQAWVGGVSKSSNRSVGKCIQSVESLKKASRVAAMATRMGRCLPARLPASLEVLCINQICLQVSAEVASHAKSEIPCSASWVTESLVESCVGIPDELISKIVLYWCSRQHPEGPCKTLVRAALSRRGHLSPEHGDGRGAQHPSTLLEHSSWESNDQGFSCHSCNQNGILKMDPKVNPAHHRYLEVQYHAQTRVAQPSGFLWNLISFVGVSIMSGALLVHFCADRNRKRRSPRPVRQGAPSGVDMQLRIH